MGLCLGSCKPDYKVKDNELEAGHGVEVQVQVSAGELIDNGGAQLPTFFNIARIENRLDKEVELIVLCERKEKNAKVRVQPIALLTFDLDTIRQNYVVAVKSTHSQINSINLDLAFDLDRQKLVAEWFRSYYSVNHCSNFKWHNAYQAIRYLKG